jgi:hypothetical protein
MMLWALEIHTAVIMFRILHFLVLMKVPAMCALCILIITWKLEFLYTLTSFQWRMPAKYARDCHLKLSVGGKTLLDLLLLRHVM